MPYANTDFKKKKKNEKKNERRRIPGGVPRTGAVVPTEAGRGEEWRGRARGQEAIETFL